MTGFPKSIRYQDADFLAEVRTHPCSVCGAAAPSTVSHIKTRGSGGGDEWFNCVPKCLPCHQDWESSSAHDFCQKHPRFWNRLKKLGWYFQGMKLKNPGYERG